MNRTGAPANCWLLTLQYVCYILNHISTGSLGGQVPLQVLYGVTPDISIILLYTFYQNIFYATHDQHFPSDSDRIPSTTPGAEPPRDARDSGSARSHSTHLETSSSNRP